MLNTGCSSVVFKKVLDQKLISVSMILTNTDPDVTAPVYRCDQRSLSTLHLSSVSVFWWSHDKSVQHTDTWNVANCLFTLNDICWQKFLSTTCQSKQPVVVCLVHARQTGVSDLSNASSNWSTIKKWWPTIWPEAVNKCCCFFGV